MKKLSNEEKNSGNNTFGKNGFESRKYSNVDISLLFRKQKKINDRLI